jgi:hypothetical protein
MADLYDEDLLLWSERPGALLRRRAADELVNEAKLDWPNIAVKIESVGHEELQAVESLPKPDRAAMDVEKRAAVREAAAKLFAAHGAAGVTRRQAFDAAAFSAPRGRESRVLPGSMRATVAAGNLGLRKHIGTQRGFD